MLKLGFFDSRGRLDLGPKRIPTGGLYEVGTKVTSRHPHLYFAVEVFLIDYEDAFCRAKHSCTVTRVVCNPYCLVG